MYFVSDVRSCLFNFDNLHTKQGILFKCLFSYIFQMLHLTPQIFVNSFSEIARVLVPQLPLYLASHPLFKSHSLEAERFVLMDFLSVCVWMINFKPCDLLGSSS